MTDPAQTTHKFVELINNRDVPRLLEAMTPDHRLVDPGGDVVVASDALRAAWGGYFRMVPDYWITIEETYTQGAVVVLLGRAGGTYAPDGRFSPERRWEVPAAWRATVRGGRVAEWRVYADNEPLRAIIERETKGQPGAGAV